jgi:hypothetical protein
MGSSAPRPTPNMEDQGISLSLAPPSKPVRHGRPYRQLCCRRHSFRVHCCTQAPSPSNKVLSTRWRYHRGGLLHHFSLKTESRAYEVTRICLSVRLCVPSNCFEVNMEIDISLTFIFKGKLAENEKVAYDVCLSVRLQLITFETIRTFSWNLTVRSCWV